MRSKRSSSPRGRRKVVLLMRRRKVRGQSLSSPDDYSASEYSVRTSVERKLQQLQRILPAACSEINYMDTLFQRTADYIFLLEAKVSLLQNLSAFYGV